jgi:hypothetical protein
VRVRHKWGFVRGGRQKGKSYPQSARPDVSKTVACILVAPAEPLDSISEMRHVDFRTHISLANTVDAFAISPFVLLLCLLHPLCS